MVDSLVLETDAITGEHRLMTLVTNAVVASAGLAFRMTSSLEPTHAPTDCATNAPRVLLPCTSLGLFSILS